jgi:hypothetical protein
MSPATPAPGDILDRYLEGVGLRFLYGVLLEDPRRVLRAGTSVLKTWDFGFGDRVDPAAVGAYVREAVGRYDDYEAARPGRRGRSGGG